MNETLFFFGGDWRERERRIKINNKIIIRTCPLAVVFFLSMDEPFWMIKNEDKKKEIIQ